MKNPNHVDAQSRAENHPCHKCSNASICEQGFACALFYYAFARICDRGASLKKYVDRTSREPAKEYYYKSFPEEKFKDQLRLV